ncbi:GAP1-N1 domain-containing protein [Sphingomonas radiodurans]|uniref:GAP1-N1 domain-containing protein n=1 Tax=Sphingomonas radiodurans TaxID=2890321 RepID=UPI001E31DC3E|nr:hypothetical protein [Sphingomonas radiodurans]WBH16491.1 hypothetical protein LLW23_17160 [Sphingomonas radiodurans]
MIVDQQLHGYRHGHELLSGTIRLPARDQDLVDRLSDIAGPIGPGEKFAPYLTCYPLPSGTHYVVARTWLDAAVPRAGCVRTRSLIIAMSDWVGLADPAAMARAATDAGPTDPGRQLMLPAAAATALPPAQGPGVELVEALFLEDSVPIAVFGAATPELLAIRILTAIWPAMRGQFTVSTFSNSPRTIAKRSFDLVFAPVGARSRFTDWKGRRVDGKRVTPSRHHWSDRIANEVFQSPHPSLLGLDVFGEMVVDERGSRDALRLSLLWEELAGKIEAEPHAALGLLDIANTRPARRSALIDRLTPTLAAAAKSAGSHMPAADAWRFLQVLIGKLGETRWQLSLARSVRSTTAKLAGRSPLEAVAAIPGLLHEKGGDFLIGGLANGIARTRPFNPTAAALAQLPPAEVLRVVLAAQDLTATALGEDVGLDLPLASGIETAPPAQRSEAFRRFQQHLVEDRHAVLLRALIADAAGDVVVAEARRLAATNRLQRAAINDVLVEAARRSGTVTDVRDIASGVQQGNATDRMLRALLDPTAADVDWILASLPKDDPRRTALLVDTLAAASQDQLRSIVAKPNVLTQIISLLGSTKAEAEVLARIAETVPLQAEVSVPLVVRILSALPTKRSSALAAMAVEKALSRNIGADRDKTLATLIGHAGPALDPAGTMRTGLASNIPAELASRNLALFDSCGPVTRAGFLRHPEVLAETIMARHVVDLSYNAAEAAGRLLWDSEMVNKRGYVRASAALLHFLMQQRGVSASPLIAAAFPSVYRELQKDSIPDFLAFVFIFLDWDRCKIARGDLAEAFLSSQWRARDIALAAARTGDAERILHNIARRQGGAAALSSMQRELEMIPDAWRSQVRKTIKDVAKRDGLLAKLPFDI